MKLNYYPETDSLYIELTNKPGVDTRIAAEGIVLDLDESGNIVGIDIDHASRMADLSRLESNSLPLVKKAG